jgi:hypothetical protein
VAAVLCAAAMVGLARPASAVASAGWAWPLEGPIAAGYGVRYTSAQGVACTHGGIDIAAPAGTTVRACADGEVVFSGQVPAGEGARSWAVTVLTSEGLRVTYLPLRRASVSKGDGVGEGAALGDLAGEGDASSAAAHLHLGVRRGETRLDPLSLLRERAAAPPAPKVELPDPSPGAVHASPRAAPSPSHVAPSVSHAAPSSARAPARVRPPAVAVAQAPDLLPHPSTPAMPTLTRIPEASDMPAVRTAEVAADVEATRGLLQGLLLRLGLAGLAGACAWPALRRVLDGQAGHPAAIAVTSRHGE